MIATPVFDRPRDGVRRMRFVPVPNVPVDAACVVASGAREALRALLGETCSVTMGEPVALDAAAWRELARDALLFTTPGRATDIVFVLAMRDARRLVQAAFGEEPAGDGAPWSALEAGAIERIVARCANACEALCVERRGPTIAADPATLPAPVAYFDVRVAAPVALTIGVGLARDLGSPPPLRTITLEMLGDVPVPVRVVIGRGDMPVTRLLALAPGAYVHLRTKVVGEGELNLAGQRIALGTCGVRHSRPAFEVRCPA